MIEYYKNLSLENLFYTNENGVLQEEKWRDIPKYIGFYKASNLGRLKSLLRKCKWAENGVVQEKILRQNRSAYLRVTLCKNGTQKTHSVHFIIANAFLNYIQKGRTTVVDHIVEGNKYDNRLSNLQILNIRENTIKSLMNKGMYVGGRSVKNRYVSKIFLNGNIHHLGGYETKEQAKEIYDIALSRINKGESIKDLIKYRKSPSSGFCGVEKRGNKYRVTIKKGGLRFSGFDTAESANEFRLNYIQTTGA